MFKKRKTNFDDILWIDEIYKLKKSVLKKVKKKQKESIFHPRIITADSKLDISVNIIEYQEFKELEIYFNSNILGTYLLLEEIKNEECNRIFEHNTDLIFLYIQCLMEYILQYINIYFSLELVESYNEQTNIKNRKEELGEYLKENKLKLNEDSIEEANEFISKKFQIVTNNNVISAIKSKYELSGILENIIVILEDKSNDLGKFRNKIAHHKSSKSKLEKSKNWINGDEMITFNNNGNVNKDEVLTIIKEELSKLEELLNCLYTIKINGLYPNSKENAGKIYKVQNTKCKNCGTKRHIAIPNEWKENMLETLDFSMILKCNKCSSQEFESGEIETSTERGYRKLIIDYLMYESK